ncbi:MAG: HAD family phosphatase [Armatimonadetes bacterium]|nr:HAD family phosphatase [Armatimonadota bacterium]
MRAVFSDIDNVLMFDLHVAPETLRLIEQVRAHARFVLVTARSFDGVSHIPPIPHDHLIVENGCVVYDGDEIDADWERHIQPYLPIVEAHKRSLGLIFRPKTCMISVGVTENGLGEEEIARIGRELPPELVLRTSSNERGTFLEMYPRIAGKAAALRYLAGKLGVAIEDTCALGDDLVDIEMLEACGYPITHHEAREAVVALVRQCGGYIAPYGGHDASAAMLREVLRWQEEGHHTNSADVSRNY